MMKIEKDNNREKDTYTFKEYKEYSKSKTIGQTLQEKICSFKTMDYIFGDDNEQEEAREFHPFERCIYTDMEGKKKIGVKAKQYVGFLRCDNKTFLVNPKIPDANFRYMLYRALRNPRIPDGLDFEAKNSLIWYLAFIFVNLFRNQIEAKGLHRDYIFEEDNFSMVRGRILHPENVRRNFGLKHKLYCGYDDYSLNTLSNQILLFTLSLLIRNSSLPFLANELMRMKILLSDVMIKKIRVSDFRWIRYNRLNEHYKTIHQICKLIITDRESPEIGEQKDSYGFFIDMNKLFEHYIRVLLEEAKEDNTEILFQDKKSLYNDKKINPDFVYTPNPPDNKVIVILDAKYKDLDVNSNSQVAESDLYQIITYCAKYNSSQAVLIYPKGKSDNEDWEIQVDSLFNDHTLNIKGWFIDIPSGNEKLKDKESSIIDCLNKKLAGLSKCPPTPK